MNRFAKYRIFQKTASAILIVFMGVMLGATFIAYSRRSGSTKQDMARAHLIRAKSLEQKDDSIAGR